MAYTAEETQLLISKYTENPTKDTVAVLSEELGKSPKSIIGKLSREGVYKREIYHSKTGELPITKVEIVSNIASLLRIEAESLSGLEKSPKAALQALETCLK